MVAPLLHALGFEAQRTEARRAARLPDDLHRLVEGVAARQRDYVLVHRAADARLSVHVLYVAAQLASIAKKRPPCWNTATAQGIAIEACLPTFAAADDQAPRTPRELRRMTRAHTHSVPPKPVRRLRILRPHRQTRRPQPLIVKV
ncbi:hypothetical protein BBBOND_0210610 [Babesia bigemina]|uniref:Uncharacterized protein n=1 Tax=Babesia bigemina TaxID=5866 RepID=A0A061D5S8_BABBI|nr:hypothetical protein BBBOND_0210610 [Babesia bigemina]CDR95908.1 hypothetical protein BBBOND_0210610 [Babesia bigemina]|eukprot:XP_012768094.1 hypothetical protein BBBOND_0210610 [Babesia bigemina]